MPVPFRDAEDLETLGAAGFLKIETGDAGVFRGALFLINARGEPLEFTYSRIETPNTFLWRQEDVRRHAVRNLTASLLSACPRVPQFVACRADEVHSELFSKEIHLSVPVCRIAPRTQATVYSPAETEAAVDAPEPLHLFWFPGKPADEGVEHQLLERLVARGLILEPFERALAGLREVYASEAARPKLHA